MPFCAFLKKNATQPLSNKVQIKKYQPAPSESCENGAYLARVSSAPWNLHCWLHAAPPVRSDNPAIHTSPRPQSHCWQWSHDAAFHLLPSLDDLSSVPPTKDTAGAQNIYINTGSARLLLVWPSILELSADGTSTPGLDSRRLQAAVEDSFIFVDVGL